MGEGTAFKHRLTHVFAIVRLDKAPVEAAVGDGPNISVPGYCVTVKAVVTTKDRAVAEVARLNALNADKNCRYYWQMTRALEDR